MIFYKKKIKGLAGRVLRNGSRKKRIDVFKGDHLNMEKKDNCILALQIKST
jgi:hypothetical protein